MSFGGGSVGRAEQPGVLPRSPPHRPHASDAPARALRPRSRHHNDALHDQGAAMTAQDIIAIFEDLSVSNRTAPLGDAVGGLADGLAHRRAGLSDEVFAVLTAGGGAMYEAALQHRMAPATFLPIRSTTPIFRPPPT